MNKLTDEELIEELKSRILQNQESLSELNRLNDRLKVVNDKLESSEALKSHFLSNIRNEINNPLASILGLSNNLVFLKSLDEKKTRSTASLIHSEAFNLDFQLRNIFMAADVEAGEAKPEPSRANFHEIINDVLVSFSHRTETKNMQVSYETDFAGGVEGDDQFVLDSLHLQLIISNLVSNAIKFSEAGGVLKIRSWLDGDELKIAVTDTGEGIEDEMKKVIFDRFTQLSTGTTKMHGGHGLGLSITMALIDLVGGRIDLQSEVDKGSTFTISLPPLNTIEGEDPSDSGGNDFLFDADETF